MNERAKQIARARARRHLSRLMEQRSRGPGNGNGRAFQCPYCGQPGAGVREHEGRQWFKCFHASCPSGIAGKRAAWDEAGFLAFELRVSRREAFELWLQEAGGAGEKPTQRGATRRSEYLPEEEEDPLPPEALDSPEPPWDPGPEPEPPSEASLAGVADSHRQNAPGTVRSLVAPDGAAAVPDPPPVADRVLASPAAPAGVPTPSPGEAALSPAATASGTPGVTRAEPPAQDAASPDALQTSVEVASNLAALPSPEAEAEAADEEDTPQSVQAVQWLHARLPLAAGHLEAVERERGLPPHAIVELGLRSSVRANEKRLREMAGIFPLGALLAAGLWTRGDRPSDEPRPNRFYFGWGPAGKRRGPNGDDETVHDWVQPILIPYRNRAGQVLDLRTHKWTQRGQSPRLYVPRRGERTQPPSFAVLTEGELKAAAIDHALGRRVLAAGLPGITMSKPLWGTLVDHLLAELPPGRPVVVVFDNEEKGTPGLPGYKEEKWKRYDSEIWARYLEQRLVREGFLARVGYLPDGWRDEKGKADWDGGLALLAEQLDKPEVLNV